MLEGHVKGITWVEIGIVAALVLIVMAIAAVANIIWLRHFRERSSAVSCQENIIKIELAYDAWAAANNKPGGTTVTMRSLVGKSLYLKKTPRCPGGGNYPQIFTVGETPTCDYTPPAWFDTMGMKYLHCVESCED